MKKVNIVPCDASDWKNWQKCVDENPKERHVTENVEYYICGTLVF